jgi:hypothetical protein
MMRSHKSRRRRPNINHRVHSLNPEVTTDVLKHNARRAEAAIKAYENPVEIKGHSFRFTGVDARVKSAPPHVNDLIYDQLEQRGLCKLQPIEADEELVAFAHYVDERISMVEFGHFWRSVYDAIGQLPIEQQDVSQVIDLTLAGEAFANLRGISQEYLGS